jgi:hypothetical protein
MARESSWWCSWPWNQRTRSPYLPVRAQAHWDEVVRFILWDHLFTVLIVCACVGLVRSLPHALPAQNTTESAGQHLIPPPFLHACMRACL